MAKRNNYVLNDSTVTTVKDLMARHSYNYYGGTDYRDSIDYRLTALSMKICTCTVNLPPKVEFSPKLEYTNI